MEITNLLQSPLFAGINEKEMQAMLSCLCAQERHFKKDKIIYCAGDVVQAMGLVVSGSVNIESIDFDGKKSIISHVTAGQLFAETYACLPSEPLMINVTAAESCDVLFLNAQRIFTMCSNACSYHNTLIRNLLSISAQKNLNLSQRIMDTAPRTIRGRLEAYLAYQSHHEARRDFTIPFDRQQLADYLNVDRSALSHELGKMEEEGLIAVQKNHFSLLK
jgi:CRP-like cAMP-binding protein